MNSIILQLSAKPIALLQIGLSLFLLLRGHNEPGGGFIGGLIAASALILVAMAYDVEKAKGWMKFDPITCISGGLLMALSSGLLAWLFKAPMMTGLWKGSLWLPFVNKVKLGTPLLFDIGVYFVVIGISTLIIFSLMEVERK